MNAKEQIINVLNKKKEELNRSNEGEYYDMLNYYNALITAVENAIFDVPSEDELIKESPTIDTYDEFIQYLRNYKKPESDEKDS